MKEVTRLFSITKAELAAKANELNFVRDTMEKVLRLADIHDYLNTNLLTKDTLALKGGTAINLTVFNLLRLSVDLDFDYSVEQSREEMLRQGLEVRSRHLHAANHHITGRYSSDVPASRPSLSSW